MSAERCTNIGPVYILFSFPGGLALVALSRAPILFDVLPSLLSSRSLANRTGSSCTLSIQIPSRRLWRHWLASRFLWSLHRTPWNRFNRFLCFWFPCTFVHFNAFFHKHQLSFGALASFISELLVAVSDTWCPAQQFSCAGHCVFCLLLRPSMPVLSVLEPEKAIMFFPLICSGHQAWSGKQHLVL